MNFTKHALTVPEQIALLKERGLKIHDEPEAFKQLSNISYYRLSAYLLSFQDYSSTNHSYMPWATFNKVIRAYVFDRELRLICLDAIERIEVAIRCRLSQEYCMRHGNNWYEDGSLYTSATEFSSLQRKINMEIRQSKEVFLKHYQTKYLNPEKPPSWMTIEILSFGVLSRMYKELKSSDAKKEVAAYFGVSPTILANFLENLAYIRNLCAHHSRLWNRTMTKKIIVPNNSNFSWTTINSPKPDKLYNSLCAIGMLLDKIFATSPYKGKLYSLCYRFPEINLSAAGFPENWKKDKFWSCKHMPFTHMVRIIYFKCKTSIQFKLITLKRK